MKSVGGLILGACLLLSGCNQQEDASVIEARRRLREFQGSLKVWNPTVRLRDGIAGTIGGWIACVSNASLRIELARELSDVILSVDLTNQPYRVLSANGNGYGYSPRERAVIFYPEFVNATCWVMKDNGCSPRLVMEFLLQALQKYKDATFGIPLDFWPLPGESLDICSVRRNCARGAYEYYVQTMNLIRRSLLPNQHPIVYVPPIELQDEFKHRIEPFFNFPSKDEFLRMMYPRYKRGSLSPSKPDVQKQEPDNHDVEVEVDKGSNRRLAGLELEATPTNNVEVATVKTSF